MWEPTHVKVTVQSGSGVLIKGKNGTNDCFVTIALGNTKYQTSVKEKAGTNVEWHEECELPIPDQGNTAEIILTALHRNFIGIDEFLGRVAIKINNIDVYEKPRNRWYKLRSKPGKEGKEKERGELEVMVAFTVKSGSFNDLSKGKDKHRSSLSHLASSVGGSLLSVGGQERRKSIKNLAKSIGSKMHLRGKKGTRDDNNFDTGSVGSVGSLKRRTLEPSFRSRQTAGDADPGVVSDDDEFTFDDLSHKSSSSSINTAATATVMSSAQDATSNGSGSLSASSRIKDLSDPSPEVTRRHTTAVPAKPSRGDAKSDEWELKLYGKQQPRSSLKPVSNVDKRRSWDSPKLSSRIEEEDYPETTATPPPPPASTPPRIMVAPASLSAANDEPKTRKQISSKSPEPTPKAEKDRDSVLKRLNMFRREKSDVEKSEKPHHPMERIIIGGENEPVVSTHKHLSNELLQKYEGRSREELILQVCNMQSELDHNRKKLKDLEDYLDNLLLRVMETTPRILQNPEFRAAKY